MIPTFLLILLLCVFPSPPVACKKNMLKHLHKEIHQISDFLFDPIDPAEVEVEDTNEEMDIIVYSSGPMSKRYPAQIALYAPYDTINSKPAWKMPNIEYYIWYNNENGGLWWLGNSFDNSLGKARGWVVSLADGLDLPPKASNFSQWNWFTGEKWSADDPTLQFYRFPSKNTSTSTLSMTTADYSYSYGTLCSTKNTSDACKQNTDSCPCLPNGFCGKCCVWCVPSQFTSGQCVYHHQCGVHP